MFAKFDYFLPILLALPGLPLLGWSVWAFPAHPFWSGAGLVLLALSAIALHLWQQRLHLELARGQALLAFDNKNPAADENGVLAPLNRDLNQAVKHISERLAHLENAVAEARNANLAKSQFIANMSHELRTPLNAVIGYSEMLAEEAEDLGALDFVPGLKKIHAAGTHLLGLINGILDISKIEAGKMDLYTESFAVAQVLNEIASTVRPLIEKKNNRLEIKNAAMLGSIHADLTKVRQILLNLLSNASKFSENEVITLEGERINNEEGEWLILRVIDRGIGMTPEQKSKLFQAFSQADVSTTRRFGGTGLGLAISKEFALMMGGRIEVDSEFGKGTQFTVCLPVYVNAARHRPEQQQGVEEKESRNAESGIVLVIDDEQDMRDLLRSYLSKTGYQVATAASGEEGLALAKKLRPHAITLDVRMPDMDGWTVLAKLKADPELADVPVVILSIEEDKETGYSLGAADYLSKPVNRGQLVQVLHKHHFREDFNVMVIDDNPVNRDLTSAMVHKMGGKVTTAEHGKAALALLEQQRVPDLILLDLMMPEMNGFEFAQYLHDHPQWRHIPIVVLTAKDLSQEEREQLSGCVKTVFQKGAYSREALLVEIRSMLITAIMSSEQAQIKEENAPLAAEPPVIN
jgi:signal transduction histidine kinase/CheY-like chemotaxis protein